RKIARAEIGVGKIMIAEQRAPPARLAGEKALVQLQRLLERIRAQPHPTLRRHGIHIESNHLSFETIPTLLKNAYQMIDAAAERSTARLARRESHAMTGGKRRRIVMVKKMLTGALH